MGYVQCMYDVQVGSGALWREGRKVKYKIGEERRVFMRGSPLTALGETRWYECGIGGKFYDQMSTICKAQYKNPRKRNWILLSRDLEKRERERERDREGTHMDEVPWAFYDEMRCWETITDDDDATRLLNNVLIPHPIRIPFVSLFTCCCEVEAVRAWDRTPLYRSTVPTLPVVAGLWERCSVAELHRRRRWLSQHLISS